MTQQTMQLGPIPIINRKKVIVPSKKNTSLFSLNWAKWVRKYPGRYIAVVDGKVLAVAKSRLKAFKKIESQISSSKPVGVFYIPTPNQYPMLLHAISLSRN